MTASCKSGTPPPAEDEGEPIECSSPPCYRHEFEAGRLSSPLPSVRIKPIPDGSEPSDGLPVLVESPPKTGS
jgi:hypothetical protein